MSLQNTNWDFIAGATILLDKPLQWTSTDAVRKLKSVLRYSQNIKDIKIGHAGTLDPLASGLLIVCTGKHTKIIDQIQAMPKEYVANIRLGATTPSYDLETEINETFPFEHISKESIEQAFLLFLGKIQQVPPLFSAKRIDGKRAYSYARSGVEMELKPAEVEIYNLQIEMYDPPFLDVRIACSKGTYIRSFAHDLGKALQSGGHLVGLRRTKIGDYLVEDAIPVESFEEKLKIQQ